MKTRHKPTGTTFTPAVGTAPLTIPELLAALPALGPWRLVGKLRMLREAKDLCPLAAVAKARKVTFRQPGGAVHCHLSIGQRLGLSAVDTEDVANAADNTGAALGMRGEEAKRVGELRAAMLVACGFETAAKEVEELGMRVDEETEDVANAADGEVRSTIADVGAVYEPQPSKEAHTEAVVGKYRLKPVRVWFYSLSRRITVEEAKGLHEQLGKALAAVPG